MRKINLKYSICTGLDFPLSALIAAHGRLDRDVLYRCMQPRIDDFSNHECVAIPGQVLINCHVYDFRLTTSFDLLVLAYGHGDQLTGGLETIRCTGKHPQLHDILRI